MLWFAVEVGILLFTAFLVVELLIAFMPTRLRQIAEANRRRPDGTVSLRRSASESKAILRLRKDLWAVLLVVCGCLGTTLFIVHLFVLPLDLGVQSLGSFSLDASEFKSNLKSNSMDRKLEKRIGSQYGLAPRESADVARMMWQGWPMFAAGALFLLFASGFALKWGYMRALHDYASSLSARREQHELRDLARAHSI